MRRVITLLIAFFASSLVGLFLTPGDPYTFCLTTGAILSIAVPFYIAGLREARARIEAPLQAGGSPRPFQYSIRTLLEVTAVVALLCTLVVQVVQHRLRGNESERLAQGLALEELVSKVEGNFAATSHESSETVWVANTHHVESHCWTLPLSPMETETFLEKISTMAQDRLSKLGAAAEKSHLVGWAYYKRGTKPGGQGETILYRSGDVRGVLTIRVVYVPGRLTTAYLAVDHVQFR